jgi:hypothetical protein
VFAALALLALTRPALGRTIILTANDADRMAALCQAAPRFGMAMQEASPGVYGIGGLTLNPGTSFLLSFRLDRIPAGSRIALAELILPVTQTSGTDPRLYVWRVLAEWGNGVCYEYRSAWPQKMLWARPGARGHSSDRGTRPTEIVRLNRAGELVINVTEDVELWHAGAAPNRGWLLSVEDPDVSIALKSPAWDGQADWKLRITYEPAPGK